MRYFLISNKKGLVCVEIEVHEEGSIFVWRQTSIHYCWSLKEQFTSSIHNKSTYFCEVALKLYLPSPIAPTCFYNWITTDYGRIAWDFYTFDQSTRSSTNDMESSKPCDRHISVACRDSLSVVIYWRSTVSSGGRNRFPLVFKSW